MANPISARNYVRTLINNVLQNAEIQPPDLTLCDDLAEVVTILHSNHLKGGVEAVQQSWKRMVDLHPELLQILKPAAHPLIIPAGELKNLPPLEWFVPGMLPKRSLCELHGASGSGKSLFTLHLALYLAKTYEVLYLAAEGVSGYSARIAAWETHFTDVASPKLGFYPNSVNLLDGKAVTEFIALLEPINPDLIVIDTLARCMIGGDENSAQDMGLAIAACDRIRNALGATILIIHHTGKIGTGEHGSSSLRGGCDSMIELTNHDGIVNVASSKLKDGKPFDTLYFTMVEYGDSVALVPTTSVTKEVSKNNPLKATDQRILELLQMEIYTEHGAAYKRISDNTGITGGSLDRILSRLKREGYLSQSKKGDPYFITAQGVTTLTT